MRAFHLESYRRSREFEEIDWEFGDFLVRRCDGRSSAAPELLDALRLLGAMVLSASRHSHSALNLKAWGDRRLSPERRAPAEESERKMPLQEDGDDIPLIQWGEEREKAPVLARFEEPFSTDYTGALLSPLTIEEWKEVFQAFPEVFSGENAPLRIQSFGDEWLVYLARFDLDENVMAAYIRGLSREGTPSVDEESIWQSSARFLTKDGEKKATAAGQVRAVCQSLGQQFAIITGGPGTGKTTVLAICLAWEQTLALKNTGNTLKIALCAPTGKATALMNESIGQALAHDINWPVLGTPEEQTAIRESLSELEAITIHRLLGISEENGRPKKDETDPLDADLLVIDESSMVSLHLFRQVVKALRKKTETAAGTRLLLLGDKNQLASVEAGTVFAELTELDSFAVSTLTETFRFANNDRLKQAVQAIATLKTLGFRQALPDVEALAVPAKEEEKSANVAIVRELPDDMEQFLNALLSQNESLFGKDWLQDGEEATDPWGQVKTLEQAFRWEKRLKILCATREGEEGVYAMNRLMRRILNKYAEYADGVPIMITRNDRVTELKNGDVGVCWKEMVYFESASGSQKIRSFPPSQLPPHECAFAMTIHKSQGSGYDNVLMVLPKHDCPILTRELVYTGMTRTKKNLVMLADKGRLMVALQRRIQRWSGLSERIKS